MGKHHSAVARKHHVCVLIPPADGPHGLLHLAADHDHYLRPSQARLAVTGDWVSLTSLFRTSDPEAFSQLKLKYGEKIPEVLYYNKGL